MDLTAKGTRKLELTANRGAASLAGILGRGPKGEDGSNVLPTDTAIAAKINDPASATKAALDVSMAAQTAPFARLGADFYTGPYVAAMGDSITALNGSTTGNQQADTHHNWLYCYAGGRLRWARTAAQAGYTLAQIRDTQLPLILAQNPLPDAVLLLGGTNDVGSSTFDLAASMAVWDDIHNQLRKQGIRLIPCTIPPRGDSTTANQKADKFNAALRNRAANLGLDLVDYHKVLVDPATGGYKAGYSISDNLHPSFLGGKEMGKYAAMVLAPRFPDVRPYLVEHALDSTDLLAGQGLFRVDTNGDGIADGWSSFSAAAYSIVTDADGTKWQRLTRDSSASGALLQKSVSSVVAPGDVIEVSARVQAGGWDAVVTPTSTVNWTFSCTTTGTAATDSASPAYAMHCDAADGVLTQRITVGAGATGQIKANLQISNAPASGSVWVQFANVTVRNLTTLGVL